MAEMNSSVWDAVIFDYGGVLCYPPTQNDVAEYARLSGLDKSTFLKLYSETRDYYGRSQDEYAAHWHARAKASGLDLAAPDVKAFIAKESELWTRPNHEMVELAREIKAAGCRLAILSNMTPELLQILRSKFDWLDVFDVRMWSCEHGCAKPDEPIYFSCLQALGCTPERALFFDDRLGNVEGARRLGITAEVFESAVQARAVVAQGIRLAQVRKVES